MASSTKETLGVFLRTDDILSWCRWLDELDEIITRLTLRLGIFSPVEYSFSYAKTRLLQVSLVSL